MSDERARLHRSCVVRAVLQLESKPSLPGVVCAECFDGARAIRDELIEFRRTLRPLAAVHREPRPSRWRRSS